MNFFPWHIGDYAAHTRNLSLLEDLAYRRLLDAYYLSEQPFNGSPTDVAREIGMRDQVTEVEYILGKFFERDGDIWRSKRADVEIAKYRGKLEQASRAGKASAERRSNASPTPVEKNPTDVDESANGRATNQEPRTKNQSPSLRSGDSAEQVQRTPSRPKSEQVTLRNYLTACKQQSVKPVPDDHYIRQWCVDANITVEMLQVAWVVFREKYTGDEKLKGKRYKDWPGHFANAVKDRWHGLWFIGEDGKPQWTSTGLQRKAVLEAEMKKPEAGNEPS